MRKILRKNYTTRLKSAFEHVLSAFALKLLVYVKQTRQIVER